MNAKKKSAMVKKKAEHPVVGVAHRITMSTRRLISNKIEQEGPLGVVLMREPRNPADENAIKVILDDAPYRDMHIGYLPRGVAKVYAPAWDKGKMEIDRATLTAMKPEDGEGEILLRFSVRRK
jgi:hypothetical protein